jgi:charged multivesicular body protein 4A/B
LEKRVIRRHLGSSSVGMNLFGRKAAPPVRTGPQATAETIRKLREQLDSLEKREAHINRKIDLQLEDAKKKSAAKDKRGAIFALKRKKMYESEIEKLQGARMTLETQVMTLESAHVNMETFTALRSGALQMKAIHGQMNVDTVDNIMDDIQEEMATADEIGRAISQPIGGQLYDEDELENELREMEELELEEKELAYPKTQQPAQVPATATTTATPPPVPVARQPVPSSAPTFQLPEVPTHALESNIHIVGQTDEDELEALRKLEASMAL